MKRFHITIRLDWDVETTINRVDLIGRLTEIVENLQADGFFHRAEKHITIIDKGVKNAA